MAGVSGGALNEVNIADCGSGVPPKPHSLFDFRAERAQSITQQRIDGKRLVFLRFVNHDHRRIVNGQHDLIALIDLEHLLSHNDSRQGLNYVFN